MNTYRASFLTFILAACLLAACNTSTSTPETPDQTVEATADSQARSGTVSETMTSGGYTYVLVDDGNEEFWAAAPEFAVSVGESVLVPPGMPMQNHHSRTLDRDFEVIYFVPSILAGGGNAEGNAAVEPFPEHPAPPASAASPTEVKDVSKADDGYTVAEIYARKAELNGQEVVVRGTVVKYSPAIMGTNWIHIQDGTGEEGSNDLTVTSAASASEGDTVVIRGILSIDQEIGGGYFYSVLVENAEVEIE